MKRGRERENLCANVSISLYIGSLPFPVGEEVIKRGQFRGTYRSTRP